ncbi:MULTISPECIES: dihydrolipoamide acetyltransferase family protein [unclassified Exiguobacterium]|uniref:dihydrolipoamide acetyltransferase family protein n=1 Tax=unclassified Exiguobacterium TaxID=2644629 RepID=UPI0010391401|nr:MULTISPECIES: dihydrolipoamide acetyltransferase family protein [unclassified Exiguobacterium]TCI39659.1 2-oxo acid dehydrogenase subunit E2 [Exiguobacterium sp. SH4S7]TCI47645.1 2-oxo acid dehydrogenase subunit E2 [Exiguobacterium sp. SH5S32]TCI54531.1 2-oxo acid dehydrogenase subunit E2 [Exiguobacterium sp. SH1S4]TCI61381.1 2-oxo acid dehydrogenase subunit E2 [Exiguobacterium sp. SH0S2]TCI74325.1 2-oxo acid dehydrogenase subunit E2 [Exiguobacterium sp. SH1S1]
MEQTIKMPQLGESVTEGTITTFLVKPGDRVEEYEPLAEVMTDKVTAEIPATSAGIIKELLIGEGDTVSVGTPVLTMEVASATDEPAELTTEDTKQPEQAAVVATVPVSAPPRNRSANGRFSPAVIRLASENDIDLDQLDGSGLGGRITRKDVLRYLSEGRPRQPEPATQVPVQETMTQVKLDVPETVTKPVVAPMTASTPSESSDRIEMIPTAGVRQAIASNMVRSKHEAPHAWLMIEVDVTNLVEARAKLKDEFFEREGVKLTFMPFFMKAAVEGLKKHPMMNSEWAGDHIKVHKDIHLSVAVAANDALYVPVIKHADEKNIKGLAVALQDVAGRARANRLKADEMRGGTFTINNTGAFGSIQSAPILNYPQAAILSVESIVKRPVWVNGMFAARDMVNLCMSVDHRVLDGLVAGQFLQAIKQSLESIDPNTYTLY